MMVNFNFNIYLCTFYAFLELLEKYKNFPMNRDRIEMSVSEFEIAKNGSSTVITATPLSGNNYLAPISEQHFIAV
jgi:hypothetical protein